MPRRGQSIPVLQRIQALTETIGDCDVWAGCKYENTPSIWVSPTHRAQSVRRLLWESVYGVIPPGVHVGTICATYGCVKIGHLALREASWRAPRDIRALFDSYVVRTPSCWIWNGKCDKDGYGRFYGDRDRRNIHRANRWAWIFAYGAIPDGLSVCHRCDNPPCVNPEHLFLGTTYENMQDRNAKNRQARGHRNGLSKLTPEMVLEIRNRFLLGETETKLGRVFGVSQSAISTIVLHKRWTHI
jgi:hypothetical protein